MAYSITLTNGTVLTSVANNTIDTTTSLTLIGRNYSGYGGYIAENFIHMLENFSNTSPPGAPLTGQLWYDSTLGKLQVWNGSAWVDTGAISDGITISGTTAQNVGLILADPSAPTGSRFYRWRVRDDAPYAGDLVLESLDDDGATVETVCVTMDHAGDAAFAGSVTAPNIRIKMNASINLYVATTGSDSNNGLTSGTPFLTLQRAATIAQNNYDTQGNNIYVQVAAGTYGAGASVIGPLFGGGYLVWVGQPLSPQNVIVNLIAPGACFANTLGSIMEIDGFTLGAPFGTPVLGDVQGDCIEASIGGLIYVANCIFGATQRAHMEVGMGAEIVINGNYMISGDAAFHWIAGQGTIVCSQFTVTLVGSRTFSGAFLWSDGGEVYAPGSSFPGPTATGARWQINDGGVVSTNGGGTGYFPGNALGNTVPGTFGTGNVEGGYYS